MSAVVDGAKENQGSSLYAALAQTTSRGIALYFSRPARLFRPAKVSGWHSLKGQALQSGDSLNRKYLSGLMKKEGFAVIPKHFLPPMMVNAMLGTVLWSAYSQTSNAFEPYLGSTPVTLAALSGAVAGGAQAIISAPAENVRLILEGGRGHDWSHAWKEVFRETLPSSSASKQQNIHEIRQLRDWIKQVGYMAGRGWNGWGWGCAKDICGFATFFAVFDVTRRIALEAGLASQTVSQRIFPAEGNSQRRFQKIIHSLVLVIGGVAAGLSYEFVSRPWDVARKTVELDRLANVSDHRSATSAVMNKLRVDGIRTLFRDPAAVVHNGSTERGRRMAILRTLARVGPWGLGFLVWETLGPGIP